jgi:hypothetical protein
MSRFATTTFLLLGTSLNDNSLKNMLRAGMKRSPANHHYIVYWENPVSPRGVEEQKHIFDVNLEVYNLISIFLNTQQIHEMISLLNEEDMVLFESALLQISTHNTRRKYYLVGSVVAGKSSNLELLRCFATFEEWSGRPPEKMYQDHKTLTAADREEIDRWLYSQLRTKNDRMRHTGVGIHIMDRAYLDLCAFSERPAENVSKLNDLRGRDITDEPIVARMKRIGFEQGKSFDVAKVEATVRKVIEDAPAQAQKLMALKVPTLARVANNWSMNTDTMGVYGTYYLKRAIIAQFGLGANLPEDAIYPANVGDENGKPLDGANKYIVRFAKDALPPVEAFWSIALYENEGFQVANPINRFAVSSWMPLKRDADGSLALHFQSDNPGNDREANWLPAPKGAFNLTMRLYAPKSEALTGLWDPPAIKRVE